MNNKGWVFLGLGFELLGLVIGALILGEKLDKYFNTNGLFVVLMLLACFLSWVIHFVILLKRFMGDLEN